MRVQPTTSSRTNRTVPKTLDKKLLWSRTLCSLAQAPFRRKDAKAKGDPNKHLNQGNQRIFAPNQSLQGRKRPFRGSHTPPDSQIPVQDGKNRVPNLDCHGWC